MATIHSSTVVDPNATLADGVEIGPFCLVGPDVTLGEGVVLHSHVVVTGHTSIGAGTKIFPFASIGHAPQDLKYAGEPSRLEIGDNNTIREHVTMNPGTKGGDMLTSVGNNCLFMAGSHIAHDCRIGDGVIMANNATLGGHVTIGDYAILGGLTAVHQFVRVGAHAMIGGMSGITSDVIPYGTVFGAHASLSGLNLIGLRRRGFEREEIDTLRQAFDLLFRNEGTLADRLLQVEAAMGETDMVAEMVAFVRSTEASRALLTPRAEHGR